MLVQADAFHLPFPDGYFHACCTSPPYWGLRKYAGSQGDEPLGLEKTPERHIERMVEVFREVHRVIRRDGVVWMNYGDCFSSAGGPIKEGGGINDILGGKQETQDYDKSRRPIITAGNLMLMPHRLAIALQDDGWIVRNDLVWFKRNPMPESVAGWRWERHRINIGRRPEPTPGTYGAEFKHGLSRQAGYREEGGLTAEWIDCPGCKKCLHDNSLFPPLHVLKQGSWRHTRAHEFIFQLVKGMGYFCNQETVRVATSNNTHSRGIKRNPPIDSAGQGHDGWVSYMNKDDEIAQTGRNPRSVLDIPTSPYSLGTKIYRLRRVAKDVVSDGMIHIALPYCREHGNLAVHLAKEFCGEHEDDLLSRIERIYSHLFQEHPGGFFPIHRHDGHCPDLCNSDWIPPEYSLSAIDHNNASHRMALSLENAIPYMPFSEMIDYIDDKRELLSYFVQHLCIYGSRIMSDDFPASLLQRIPHRNLDKQQAEALKASNCSCLIYENYTKKADHYATFPPNLIAPLIRASVPRRCCAECGMAWAPVVEKQTPPYKDTRTPGEHTPTGDGKITGAKMQEWLNAHPSQITDYRPTCEHITEPVPGRVLDIFGGSGTTGMVAKELMRNWVVMDISRPYLDEQAKIRTRSGSPSNVLDDLPLFDGIL